MYSSEFDGASLFSGGGFMPSQATQFNDSGFSPAKSRANQCTLQLTVKQISDADQASDDKSNFIIDGVDVNSVTLVGMVTNKVEKITDVNFTLDDGTGRIDIHRWVNDAAESNQLADVTNGIYVRVTGQLKGFQGKKQIVAFSVKPVTDFNEIAYHFIECMYVHLYNVKLQQISGSVHPQTVPGMSNSFQNGPMGHQTPISNKFPGYLVDAGSDFDQMVLTIFHEPENLAKESGVHVDTIVERLGVPRNKVMASINYHTDNGNIYSTIDDYHYKSTING
ncbi:replication protein A subunit A [Cinnamomum micranthum f. kanehirae]|uniref:Replication protein A subunit A n=1 Tax=Cinnamomum micranthum f. kanehirae TaxID=337451 RepID=A0A443NXX0_9MAGN|nr:replication protein A subunit A [Cinnamomum micranthum f. kanehirae]